MGARDYNGAAALPLAIELGDASLVFVLLQSVGPGIQEMTGPQRPSTLQHSIPDFGINRVKLCTVAQNEAPEHKGTR